MKVTISQELLNIYQKEHKNFDYAITAALDNFDPESFVMCFRIVNNFELTGKKCEISIGDSVEKRIREDLELKTVDTNTIELLLWIGAVLPEV